MSRNYTSTLSEGDIAPDFTLPGVSVGDVRLTEELTKSNILLVFLRGTF